MSFLSPIKLWDPDKLQILKRLDHYRHWSSLDEKRYCLVCAKIITGRDIQVIGGTRGSGPLRIICPTGNCHSIPMDWVLPTDEVLQNTQAGGDGQHEVVPVSESRAPERKDSIGSRLRKLTMRLGRHAGVAK
jgi:hypothetical protein